MRIFFTLQRHHGLWREWLARIVESREQGKRKRKGDLRQRDVSGRAGQRTTGADHGRWRELSRVENKRMVGWLAGISRMENKEL